MFTHEEIWTAIDSLAKKCGYSTSGLAKQAGLDPTAFNKSKRLSPDGKPRWPSTESIAKILAVTNMTLVDLLALNDEDENEQSARADIPVISLSLIRKKIEPNWFKTNGRPQPDKHWTRMVFHSSRDIGDPHLFAIEMDSDALEPIYRSGDRLIVSPKATYQPGDRIIVNRPAREGRASSIRQVIRREGNHVFVSSCLPNESDKHEVLEPGPDCLIARIVWVSQ